MNREEPIRIGQRLLVEMRERPGEWWMGEMKDGRLFVRGSDGPLDEAADAQGGLLPP